MIPFHDGELSTSLTRVAMLAGGLNTVPSIVYRKTYNPDGIHMDYNYHMNTLAFILLVAPAKSDRWKGSVMFYVDVTFICIV